MGRRLMAPTRLALGVEQTPVGSSSLASRGGSQSASRSWWARSAPDHRTIVTLDRSQPISTPRRTTPRTSQSIREEQDRQVGELDGTYTKKTGDTSQRHVVNMCLARGSSWCAEKVFLAQKEKAGFRCLCRNRSSVHGEQVQQPWNTLDLLRALGRQNKKERGSSGGSDDSHQRHALSLAERVRSEHGA